MTALTPTDAASIPEDIRLLADLLVRRNEERKFSVGGQSAGALAKDIFDALLAERERCAAQLEQKALLMRGSVTGDTMARIFEAEAIAIRNANTLVKHHHLPSGAAACAADSPARSTSSPISSGTNPPFAAPAVPNTTTPSSESPEGEAQSLSGTHSSEVTA